MNYRENKYLLIGLGLCNQAIKEFFDKEKIAYSIYDDYKKSINKEDVMDYTYIIKSPSVTLEHPIILNAKKLNIPVISDLELFYLIKPKQKYISITGSNGKTTVAYFLHQLLNECQISNFLVGNIGIPLFTIIDKVKEDDLIIVETSSYMLESINHFKPLIHAITNIYHHHLDHHKCFKNYFLAKIAPLKNNSIIVYPKENLLINNELKLRKIESYSFSTDSINSDFCLKSKILSFKNESYYVNDLDKFSNIDQNNLLISFSIIMILRQYFSNKIVINNLLNNIKYLKKYPFREEIIKNTNEITIINDSKATNYYATLAATNNLIKKEKYQDYYKIIIIGGKKQNYNHQKFYFFKYYDEVLIYGENKNDLDTLINKYTRTTLFNNLEEVFEDIKTKRKRISNHIRLLILFSPMSASHDQYSSYIERGEHFDSLVNSIVDFL